MIKYTIFIRNSTKKAGSGNRTRMISLEGWSFAIKLYPHSFHLRLFYLNSLTVQAKNANVDIFLFSS